MEQYRPQNGLRETYKEKDADEPMEDSFVKRKLKPLKPLLVEAAELISCDPETSPVKCETFIYDPDESEEKLGSLYMVFETINSSEKATEVMGAVATAIRKEYFRDTERDMIESLESALDQANHVLGELAEQGESEWVENFHASVCVFSGQIVHISKVGNAQLLLARKGHLNDIAEGLSDNNIRRPKHAFTSVASGNVAEEDILILSTPDLTSLIPKERINKMVTGKDPSTIVNLFRSLLDDSRENNSLSCLILRFVKAPERLPAPQVPVTMPPKVNTKLETPSRVSVRPRRPIQTERTFWSTTERIVSGLVKLIWLFLKTKIIPGVMFAASWIGGKTSSATKFALGKSQKALKRRKKKLEPQEEEPAYENEEVYEEQSTDEYQRETEDSYPDEFETEEKNKFFGKFSPKKSASGILSFIRSPKILIAVIVIFAILLTGSLVALSRKKKNDAAIQAIAEKIQEARVKKDSADAALIYNNTEQARQLVSEAKTALNEASKTEYYKADIASLLASLQGIQDKMEKIERIQNPNTIGDFASVAPNLKTPGMASIDNAVYAFDPTNNSIYKYDIEKKEAKVVSQKSEGIGYFQTAVPIIADKMILFSTDTPGMALFDTKRSELMKQEIKYPEGVKTVAAMGVFGSRMYILSPENKMVYGFSKTLAGYEGGNAWLKDTKIPIEKVVAMGIDGYIYLLTNDGKIYKLLKGAPVDFKQADLAEPMKNPTRLIASETIKHLYILDPAQKRVVVYDTTGNLTKQYVFPNAKGLSDIAVTGKEDTLVVLDQTKIYSVPLK